MFRHHVYHLKNKAYRDSLITSFIFLLVSLVINFIAGTYAEASISNPVTDIILSNIPVFDVDQIFIYGAIFFIVCIAAVCFEHPERTPFTIKAISLFVVIRSIFISLTHIAPFPTHVVIDPLNFISYFTFGGDLFFSGHAGLPFLMALIFWDKKNWRIFFIIFSIFLGGTTLLGHLHYSIDVFAAFFITYAIFGIAEQIFKKDKKWINEPFPVGV
jgi:hypothetical protein